MNHLKLFRKITDRQTANTTSIDFPRLQLLRFIEAREWQRGENMEVSDVCAFALVLSQDNKPVIYVREREPEGEFPWTNSPWIAHAQKSLEDAEQTLQEILQENSGNGEFTTLLNINSSVASKKGLLRFPLGSKNLSVFRYGFVTFNLDSDPATTQVPEGTSDADFVFSIGITLDRQLQSGWRPTTKAHWDWIYYYFNLVAKNP